MYITPIVLANNYSPKKIRDSKIYQTNLLGKSQMQNTPAFGASLQIFFTPVLKGPIRIKGTGIEDVAGFAKDLFNNLNAGESLPKESSNLLEKLYDELVKFIPKDEASGSKPVFVSSDELYPDAFYQLIYHSKENTLKCRFMAANQDNIKMVFKGKKLSELVYSLYKKNPQNGLTQTLTHTLEFDTTGQSPVVKRKIPPSSF